MPVVNGPGTTARAPKPSPPPRQVRPRRTEVRQRLLSAALTVFTDVGYERASIERVAAAAGFSKGAVYSNFASKDELFAALMDQQVSALISQVREALAVPHAPADAGRLAGERLAAALSQEQPWRLLFLDYVVRAIRDPALREGFTAHRRRVRQLVADSVVELAGPNPTFSPDEIALAVLALSNGLAIEQLADPRAVGADLYVRVLDGLMSATASTG
ncbi:MAG: TetR/AcrR family transcriptional regulator [Dermatophilaceae bacterium]